MNFDLSNPQIKELIDIITKKRAIIITGAGITNATVNDEIRPSIGAWFSY